jgi:peptidoglycan L-alanyl-D-glutamate endopeptidase CwlK
MPAFSAASLRQLETIDPRLQILLKEAIKTFDFTILEGHRGEEKQHACFLDGSSKLDWPNGQHNSLPSRAVDLAPYPINWKDEKRWHYFVGFMIGLARGLGIDLVSGHDWDHDNDLEEHTFQDSPHFQLR